MDALFVTSLELNENEGIYKKIYAEASAIGKKVGNCFLVTQKGAGALIVNTSTGEKEESNMPVLKFAKRWIVQKSTQLLYIRLMVPSFDLISLMKEAQKRKTKVYYEIPTYPYYGEQYKASRKKYRAIAKICIDACFSPLIKHYADSIVVIRSNSRIKLHKKMVEITNGVKTDNIKSRKYNIQKDNVFRMVTVGTLYPYHGYDRVLAGLKECGENIDGIPVEFHVIGASQTINELKEYAHKLGLERVFFHGMKTTEELNIMYDEFDIGLGCLALHRRNADIDTTLKIIEYYCRGVPVVTSGKSPYIEDDCVTITIPDGEDAIDIRQIYNMWKNIDKSKLIGLSENAKKVFSWDYIMKQLIKKTM